MSLSHGAVKPAGPHQSSGATESELEARHWAEYVRLLKDTTDSMHDICAARRNVLGCEEALIYLTNAVRDFQALISAIQVETDWENLEKDASVPLKEKTDHNAGHAKAPDVFARLAYGGKLGGEAGHAGAAGRVGLTSGRLVTPRSAMDIPQTKSSMAKIAYSRQLLWQRQKKLLAEKLHVKRRQQREGSSLARRRSLPAMPGARAARPEHLADLEAICEEDQHASDSCSLKTQAGHCSKSEPYPLQLDMDGDAEWRALTEEEESLAHEEASLKKEIEDEEMTSIDAEVHRRVILDFSEMDPATSSRHKWKAVVEQWDMNSEEEEETPAANNAETKKFDTENWVERQQKAEDIRAVLREQKAVRLKALHDKVDEIRQKRLELTEKKRLHIQKKMEKAAENRQKNIDQVVKQAKEADQRVLEVNFINSLEAENVKFDRKLKEQDREKRIQRRIEEIAKNKERGKRRALNFYDDNRCASALETGKKEQIFAVALADGTQPPADFTFDQTQKDWCCPCSPGGKLNSDLDIVTHFCTKQHFESKGLNFHDFSYVYLRQELATLVECTECNDLDSPSTTNNAELSKVRQKLLKTAKKPSDAVALNSRLEKRFSAILSKFTSLLKSEQDDWLALDKGLSEWRREFLKLNVTTKREVSTALSRAFSIVFDDPQRFCRKVTSKSGGNFLRVLTKLIIQLADFCTVNAVAEEVLWSREFVLFFSFISQKAETISDTTDDYIASLHLLNTLLCALRQPSNPPGVKVRARLRLCAQLLQHARMDRLLAPLLADHRSLLELPFGCVVQGPKLCADLLLQVVRLSRDFEEPAGLAAPCLIALLEAVVALVYDQICAAPLARSAETSLCSSVTTNGAPDAPLMKKLEAVVGFWSALWETDQFAEAIVEHLSQASHATTKTTLKLVHMFNVLLRLRHQTGDPDSTIRLVCGAVSALAAAGPQSRRLCLLGWTHSTLVQLSDLPVQLFQNPRLRHRILFTLASVLCENEEALSLIEGRINKGWVQTFVQQLSNTAPADLNPRLLPPERLASWLRFFSHALDPDSSN